MTQLSQSETKRISSLARLGLTEAELKQAAIDLKNVLGHFAVIQKIDTSNVPASDEAFPLDTVTRPDIVNADNLATPAALLKQAPSTQDDEIKVSAVFT